MNFGAVPPDLTNMLKTRKYREQGTLEAYLLAFGKEAPKDLNIADGFSYNPLVDGQITAMPPPFVKGDVTYDDGSEPDEEQIAKDITAFLEFTADTHKTERETAARIAFPIFFLLVLVLWALKRA